MTIKEVEQQTGLQRSNIRFYEKEKLIDPKRNSGNGYREYSQKDVEEIRKIAYLRTLGITVEDIRKVIRKEASLYDVIENQTRVLEQQLAEMKKAREMCGEMLKDKELCFEELDIKMYLPDKREPWKENPKVSRKDTVGFLYLWGGEAVWGCLVLLSLLLAVLSYAHLPEKIPVQWSFDGEVTSLTAKKFIFVYPAACIVIRFLLRPFIWRWLQIRAFYSDMITNYVTNYLCFIAVSAEGFTMLYIGGILEHITVVLLLDTAVLIGLLIIGWTRAESGRTEEEKIGFTNK